MREEEKEITEFLQLAARDKKNETLELGRNSAEKNKDWPRRIRRELIEWRNKHLCGENRLDM